MSHLHHRQSHPLTCSGLTPPAAQGELRMRRRSSPVLLSWPSMLHWSSVHQTSATLALPRPLH